MRDGNVHLEGSSFRFFYLVLISYVKSLHFTFFSLPKMSSVLFLAHRTHNFYKHTQLTFTCSKSTTEILKKGVKYIQN